MRFGKKSKTGPLHSSLFADSSERRVAGRSSEISHERHFECEIVAVAVGKVACFRKQWSSGSGGVVAVVVGKVACFRA